MITTAGGMQITGPATRTPPSPTGPARRIRGLPFLVAHAVLAAAAVLIAGCGGGDGEPRDPGEAAAGAPTADAAREGGVPVIPVLADVASGAGLEAAFDPAAPAPAEPGNLQRALEGLRGPVILELAPGRHLLAPSDFVDLSCGNCADPEESVEATLGMRVAGSGIRIRGVNPDSVVIHTHGGYGVFFEGCHDCALSGVTVTGGVRDPDDRATSGGVVARDATVEISNCRIADNVGDSAVVAETVVGIAGIVGREGSHLTVEGCRIERNSWDGIALYRGARAEIRNNVIDGVDQASGARIGGGRGVGIGLTWNARATVEGNLVRRYWKGIGAFVDAEATIRHNVVEEILTWGIAYWAAGDGSVVADIRENAVYRTGACGAMLDGPSEPGSGLDEAAGASPGAFVGNALVETAANPAYDSGQPYCTQAAIAMERVPEGFEVAENLFHGNRFPGRAHDPPDQLDAAGFREAAAPLLTALGRYPALEGSSFVTTWRRR